MRRTAVTITVGPCSVVKSRTHTRPMAPVDGKGRVAEWMQAQPSDTAGEGMTWSVVTSAPYMDMLFNVSSSVCSFISIVHTHHVSSRQLMFGPLRRRPDGTYVFATPIGQGEVPMIALSDLGYFARYTFDNRTLMSGKDLKVASDLVTWDYLVATFQSVTGQKAVVQHQSLEDWFSNFDGVDKPIANERPEGDGSTTWRGNFTGWWALWRDGIITRDMEFLRRIHPGLTTLESWMRKNDYRGQLRRTVLKNSEDGKTISPRIDRLALL